MKAFDGREKSLLRSSVADLLPESIVGRRKSHYPSTKDPAYENALRNQLIEIATDSNAPVSSLIDATVIKRIKNLPLPESSWQRDRMSLDMVLHINNWLSHYKVDISL
jgi:asparagine synthase (glutamine-hydrolysing)